MLSSSTFDWSWEGGQLAEWTKRYLVSAAFSGMWHCPAQAEVGFSIQITADAASSTAFSFLHQGRTLLLLSDAQCMLLLTHLILFCLKISDVLVLNLCLSDAKI